MPTSARKLYCASSIEGLQKKADIKVEGLVGKDTSMLCKTAEKIWIQAERYTNDNDEELAYVFYFKFVELVLALQKRSDFAKEIPSKFLSQHLSDSLQRATELKASLLKRYAFLKENQQKIDDIKNTSKSTDHVIDTAVEHSISVAKLLSLMSETKSSFIIMDTRSNEDFEESHIKHSSCINIPSNIITPGITANQIERSLPEASTSKWRERSKVDYIVLIDWSTTEECKPPGHPLCILEDAICKWDVKTPLAKPLILNGGFQEWHLRYPMHCTKALNILSLNPPKEVSCITDVSDIDFPDFDETAAGDENTLVINKNKKNAGFNENLINVPTVNRKSKPREPLTNIFGKTLKHEFDTPFKSLARSNSNVDISSLTLLQPTSSDLSKGINRIPHVNRNLKPAKLSTSDKEPSYQDVNLKFHYSASAEAKEEELSKIRLVKKLEAEESRCLEVQKQEDKLRKMVKLMELEKRDVDAKCLALKEENDRVVKLLEVTNSAQDSKEEKQTEELPMLEEMSPRPKKKLAVHENGSNFDIKLSGDDVNKGEYAVSLVNSETSCDNRVLPRSYSSPNIVQLVSEPLIDHIKKSLPPVDRSLKPNIDNMFLPVSDSQCRIRTLKPVYGNCPARPVTGLRNLGNTCFMNSIIQCLSNTEQLANYFTTEQYRHHVNRHKGSNGEIAEEFAVVIRALHAGSFKSIYPKDLKNTLKKYIPMCAGSEQQDSHEFFLAFYEQLHGDLNQGCDGDPLPDLEAFSETIAIGKFWEHHRSRNHSKLSETFEGLLQSTLSCLSCGKKSHSFEVFSCLSLPIPSSKCSLKDCLTSFLRPEKMSGDGAWHCPACKQKKEAEKMLSICKLPKILIVQLKRFCYDGMWRKKHKVVVEFHPLLEIQLGKVYELYGIVQHFGYLEGGHYTATCKNATTGKWYTYDDHDVSEVDLNDIEMDSAYLLFYTACEQK